MLFRFDGIRKWSNDLISMKCVFPDCNTSVQIGLPLCSVHLKTHYQVEIRSSSIVPNELGLFACRVFLPHEFIVPYQGEILTESELSVRYDENDTAPYAINTPMGIIDGALWRGIASMVNHSNCGNCVTVALTENVWVTAVSQIADGEEISFNYFGATSDNLYEFVPGIHSTY